jgi:hypothetical protein
VSRPVFTTARGLLASAVLLAGCGEDFATGPEKFTGELDVTNWGDTLVVGDHRAVTARVLDAQGRQVLGRSIQWTIATPGVVNVAVPGSANAAVVQSAGSAILSVAGGTAVAMEALTPGTSTVTFVFADELFHETTAARTLTVVTAGIQLASARDTTLTAIGDTATVVASALGHDAAGEDETRSELGVEWTRTGNGAIELLGTGDSVRAVARQNGTDTLVVSHGFCKTGAICSDTVLVHVVTSSEPPPPVPSVSITPVSVDLVVNAPQQFSVAGTSGPYVWSVDGVDGGNATKGTVDGAGAYVAPASVPAGGTMQVCVRLTAQPAVSDCATVTITALPPPPPAGADLVVVNDVDMWSPDYGMSEGNQAFFANLVGYAATGFRAQGHAVMSYIGSGSGCGDACKFDGGMFTGAVKDKLTALGYTLVDEASSLGAIPADVKVLFIWMPREVYGPAEVNALKQFASEGGRIVVVGENIWYYGEEGIAVENALLANLGSQLVNHGDCFFGFGITESDHQLVSGVAQVELPCASTMTPGPNDFAVARDPNSGNVVIAVTKIDLTPMPE